MWIFAWRNLLTRPLRTALALVGLSIPILGVIGLFSLSGAVRQLVGSTLSRIQGVVVLREGAFSPVFSDLTADIGEKIAAVPGVRVVTPEVWKIAPSVEGRSAAGQVVRNVTSTLFNRNKNAPSQQFQSMLDQPVIVGQDPTRRGQIKSEVFPRALIQGEIGGRYLEPRDMGKQRVVISTKVARDNPLPNGSPRRVGDSIDIGGKSFEIIGLYETGSMFLDVVMIMPIDTARRLLNVSPDTVSSFYVEGDDPSQNDQLTARIEKAVEGVDGRSPNEIAANFGSLMNQLDMFLLATVLLALLVGVVGIINTMLMSTTERFAEFGVLRTNGWSRRDVLGLVTAESAYLGLLAGFVGFAMAWLFTLVANQFLTSTGLSLAITAGNATRGLLLAVVMGMIGGFYPAWKASRMVPMAAIRLGAA
jgi:putative ABC transport system permease protein